MVLYYFFRRRQPPAGAGRPPNIPLPIQKPFAETWYETSHPFLETLCRRFCTRLWEKKVSMQSRGAYFMG